MNQSYAYLIHVGWVVFFATDTILLFEYIAVCCLIWQNCDRQVHPKWKKKYPATSNKCSSPGVHLLVKIGHKRSAVSRSYPSHHMDTHCSAGESDMAIWAWISVR